MYDFSFCVPSSENPAKNGTSEGVCHSTGSPQWAFFPQALVRDDFVWIQLTERHTSKQKAEQWIFSWGGMKAWSHGWDLWTGTYQIPHVVREPREHTHPPQMPHLLITLYHLHQTREAKYSRSPRPSEVRRRCRNISQNKTFITTCSSAAHILAKA